MRLAFTKVLDWFENAADHLVFIGHVKDIFLTKNDTEVNIKALDLTGKLKNIVSSGVDAIGILYREDSNTNVLSFETSEEVECGSRFDHLSNQKIVISEKDEKGVITTHWDKIFLTLKQK